MLVAKYDVEKYPFRRIVMGYFDNVQLELLHNYTLDKSDPIHDQGTSSHKTVYAALNGEFFDTYYGFARSLLIGFMGDGWMVQKVPTFRFQFPGKRGTKEFHRDRDYNHVPETTNIVVPLTTMYKTAAIQVEAYPWSKGVFESMDMNHGEFCIFDGANSRHGTTENRENRTRVSFDFRLLQEKHLPTDGRTTVNQKVPFSEYYVKL